jgi:hypothetical protein
MLALIDIVPLNCPLRATLAGLVERAEPSSLRGVCAMQSKKARTFALLRY